MMIEGAMQTPDGAWRVEAVRRGQERWFRLIHGESVIDWLSIATVERLLGEAGVSLTALVEAEAA